MPRVRLRSFPAALLLTGPLLLVAGWIAYGISHPNGPVSPVRPPVEQGSPPAGVAPLLPGFAEPEADLPADRLHERVDGAEDYLRSQGCVRLLAWELSAPRATLEILLFETQEGAGRVLARDAGPTRTPGPGEEASADAQGVLFRRGRAYVRLIADPEAPESPERLMAEARRVDEAVVGGLPRGR